MNQFSKTSFIHSSFFFLTMTCVVYMIIQILTKNGVLTVFLTVLIYMCDHAHMMVTHILFDVTIQ
jgi:hypothetical protein